MFYKTSHLLQRIYYMSEQPSGLYIWTPTTSFRCLMSNVSSSCTCSFQVSWNIVRFDYSCCLAISVLCRRADVTIWIVVICQAVDSFVTVLTDLGFATFRMG
ncbi:hypothetical protein MPTK2_3g16490 [Marchantia polymorpha subsp. ruderalis]